MHIYISLCHQVLHMGMSYLKSIHKQTQTWKEFGDCGLCDTWSVVCNTYHSNWFRARFIVHDDSMLVVDDIVGCQLSVDGSHLMILIPPPAENANYVGRCDGCRCTDREFWNNWTWPTWGSSEQHLWENDAGQWCKICRQAVAFPSWLWDMGVIGTIAPVRHPHWCSQRHEACHLWTNEGNHHDIMHLRWDSLLDWQCWHQWWVPAWMSSSCRSCSVEWLGLRDQHHGPPGFHWQIHVLCSAHSGKEYRRQGWAMLSNTLSN